MKKIHRYILASSVLSLPILAQAQSPIPNSGGDNEETGLIEEIFKVKDSQDKFHLYLNTQMGFNLDWNGTGGDEFQGGNFKARQLRLEMKGNINDWLAYRFRVRFNKSNPDMSNFDNVMKNIDYAEVTFKHKDFSLAIGKQCTAYGGIEFDLNPIEIYQYCDMVDYMDNYMTGVRAAWQIKPTQQLQLQILNSTALNPGYMYGENIEKAKLPLLYTLNWNGDFGGDLFSTRYSVSFMNEIKGRHLWYLAFGHNFNFTPKWGAYFDVMYMREGIDRQGIITGITGQRDKVTVDRDGVPTEIGRNVYNTQYLSLVLHTNYFVHPKWNVFGKVAWEPNGVYKTNGDIRKGTYSIDWLYIGGIEYYPMKNRGLHFFLTYVGQNVHSLQKAMAYGRPKNSFSNRLTTGFIWQIPIF